MPFANDEVAFPCTTRFPVVVAPPKTVRPVDCVPLPIVDDPIPSRPFVYLRSDENMFAPEKVLLSARRVEDAAVIVIEEPTLKLVLLIVPKEPVRRFVPTEV